MNQPLRYNYPRDWRIVKPSQYKAVFNKAKRLRTDQFTLLFIPNSLAHPRLGMAISNKHSGSVVKRNKCKRILREFFRKEMSDIGGVDLVYVSNKNLLTTDSKQLRNALTKTKHLLSKKLLLPVA